MPYKDKAGSWQARRPSSALCLLQLEDVVPLSGSLLLFALLSLAVFTRDQGSGACLSAGRPE